MKRILVTGATGFIGTQCVEALQRRGFEVHGTSRHAPARAARNAHHHRADLLRSDALETLIENVRPTHLLHLAWYAVPGKYWTAPENLDWIAASLRLLRKFAACGGQRVVSAGTCAEYDWTHGVCREGETPLHPATLYGICKAATHQVFSAFAAQQAMSAAWAHIFYLYGPGEDPQKLVTGVASELLTSGTARCSSGEQRRDFLHVIDVAEALAALTDSDVTGDVNIGSGKAVSVRELVAIIAQIVGKGAQPQFGALPAAKQASLVVAAVERLTREVGWRPRYSLEDGLAEVVAGLQERLTARGGKGAAR